MNSARRIADHDATVSVPGLEDWAKSPLARVPRAGIRGPRGPLVLFGYVYCITIDSRYVTITRETKLKSNAMTNQVYG